MEDRTVFPKDEEWKYAFFRYRTVCLWMSGTRI